MGEAPDLCRHRIRVAGERTLAEERPARPDRLRRGVGVEIESDIRGRRCRERREALLVEGRDRAEARVLRGELSPPGAGLVVLEPGRNV